MGDGAVVHRILVVEDESRIAAFMEKGFRKHGYSVTIARDGVEAVEKGLAEEFDLMLLDLGLPGKDGWVVLQELQAQGKRPPMVIIVTARDDIRDMMAGEHFNVNDYVTKPFGFNDLLDRVKKLLGGA